MDGGSDADTASRTRLDPRVPADPADRRPVSTVLRQYRDFRVFWAGETVSLFGAQVSLLALPLTALLVLNATPRQLGLLRFIEYLPFLLLAMPLGVLADRRRRRPLLIVANAARALLIGAIPVLAGLGILRIGSLAAVSFGVGTFTVLFDVCLMAYLPALVGPEHLLAANSRVSLSLASAEVSGPGLAGLLTRLLTAPACLAVNAASYLVSVVTLLMIRSVEPPAGVSNRSAWHDLKGGLRFVVRSAPIRAVTLAGALYNLAWILCQTAFLIYAQRDLRIDVAVIGVILAVGASGGIAGAAAAPRLAARLPFGRAYAAATAVATLPTLLIPAATGNAATLSVVFAALFFVANAGLGVYNVLTSTLRQAATPDRLLGRMAAAYRTLVFGGLSLGGLVAAALGGFLSPRGMLWVAGAIFAAALVPILLSPVPGYRSLPAVS